MRLSPARRGEPRASRYRPLLRGRAAGRAAARACSFCRNVVVAGRTSIGARTRIFPFASIGHEPQDLKYKGEASTLTIGADCLIREGVTMNPGTASGGLATTMGDRGTFLANAHVAHDCRVGHGVIFSNNVMLAGHCRVGDYAILGGGAAVHQFVRIGAHAFVGGLAGVENDVIPYGMALGNRAYLAGPEPRRAQTAGLHARADPRSAAGLSPRLRGRGHAQGADRGRGQRNSPPTPRCRRSSISSAAAATARSACRARRRTARRDIARGSSGEPLRLSSWWQASIPATSSASS